MTNPEADARAGQTRRRLTGDRNQCPTCGEFFQLDPRVRCTPHRPVRRRERKTCAPPLPERRRNVREGHDPEQSRLLDDGEAR
jgi:hypothetical protein